LQQNHAGASASDDPEYIHQMRVATRRLRAALRLFGPLLPAAFNGPPRSQPRLAAPHRGADVSLGRPSADFAAPLLMPLRELMLMLGRARDYDVLLAEIAEPVLHALPDEPRLAALVGVITERRYVIRQEALRLLRAPRYGSSVLQVLATLHGLNTKVGAGPSQADVSPPVGGSEPGSRAWGANKVGAGETAQTTLTLLAFAESRLRRLRKKVLQLVAHAHVDNPASLHELRIGIKRLRYALEFFTPLAAPKAMQRLLAHLAELQDTLGQVNDLANAGALLMNCADEDPPLREAVTLIGGWHGPRHQELLAAVPGELKRLGKLRLPKFRGKSG
jgi:adenylate cyclase